MQPNSFRRKHAFVNLMRAVLLIPVVVGYTVAMLAWEFGLTLWEAAMERFEYLDSGGQA
jgi:ABC-type sugar transport system permease subunit